MSQTTVREQIAARYGIPTFLAMDVENRMERELNFNWNKYTKRQLLNAMDTAYLWEFGQLTFNRWKEGQ